jgi:iron complex outermembrane receptor protein
VEAAQPGLQDIAVAAQRRTTNLQDGPISVVAANCASRAHRGIVSTDTLSPNVLSLMFTRLALGSTPYVRGVGSQSTVVSNENAAPFMWMGSTSSIPP